MECDPNPLPKPLFAKGHPPYKHPGAGGRRFATPREQSFAARIAGTLDNVLDNIGEGCSRSDVEEMVHVVFANDLRPECRSREGWDDVVDAFIEKRPVQPKEMLERLRRLAHAFHYKTALNRGLVMLDVAAMLECRARNREETRRRVIHLKVDASPQNGHEILGCKFEAFVSCGTGEIDMSSGDLFDAPVVGPPCGPTTLYAKGMALTHIIFLLAGPHAEEMRLFTHQVYSVVSTPGVEAGLVNFPDLINDYLLHEGMAVHSQSNYLFPRALVLITSQCLPHVGNFSWRYRPPGGASRHSLRGQMVGGARRQRAGWLVIPEWNNMIDSIFQECLSALPFWPCFREVLSDVTQFLREKGNRLECRSIAGRRWGTIASVLRRLAESIAYLAVRFRVDDWKKDGAGVKGMAHATKSSEWQRQLKLCSKFSAVAEAVRVWGTSSCRCHGLVGSAVDEATCPEKGRNLPYIGEMVKRAEADITKYVREDLDEACGGSDALISAIDECYANFVRELRHKTAFMDELPWLVVFGDPHDPWSGYSGQIGQGSTAAAVVMAPVSSPVPPPAPLPPGGQSSSLPIASGDVRRYTSGVPAHCSRLQ